MHKKDIFIIKIAVINIPLKTKYNGREVWITVPPQGYGGIQWNVAALVDALLELGEEIYLLGAPGSFCYHEKLHIIPVVLKKEIALWLAENDCDIVHDFSNGTAFSPDISLAIPFLSTHHFTGIPCNMQNAIFVSYSQRDLYGDDSSPIIRVPVNPARYSFSKTKDDYFLFLGRVSEWKGAYEAAKFSQAFQYKLLIAGPTWEENYLKKIQKECGQSVEFLGEVSGRQRQKLLAKARAVLVFSRSVMGPWGEMWSEPGATVVSEAAVSGTPVIASDNGCLKEIVPYVGIVIPEKVLIREELLKKAAINIFSLLPSSLEVRQTAIRKWGHLHIGQLYVDIYKRIIAEFKESHCSYG